MKYNILSGERYDFVINTDNRINSYWIQLRALKPCENRTIQQLAILQYDGAPDVPTTSRPLFAHPLPEGIVSNMKISHLCCKILSL
jgi:hypothetical protein